MTRSEAGRLLGKPVEVAAAYYADDAGVAMPTPQTRWRRDWVVAAASAWDTFWLVLYEHGPIRLRDGDMHVRMVP